MSISSFGLRNPYTQQLPPSVQQAQPRPSPFMQIPPNTADDRLGPGNTAPNPPPAQYPDNYPSPQMVGMGGSVRQSPLPLRTVQQPVSQQQVVTRPPIGSSVAQGNINYQQGGPMVVTKPPVSSSMAQGGPPRDDLLMPGGWKRNPGTEQGGIMTQSHPDFIGRTSSDHSGGVRPGAMPPMNAVQAARLAQQNQGK